VPRSAPRARSESSDFRKDPLDAHDLADRHPEVVQRLAKALEAWRRSAQAARLKPDSATAGTMSAEELERLRALGYVQSVASCWTAAPARVQDGRQARRAPPAGARWEDDAQGRWVQETGSRGVKNAGRATGRRSLRAARSRGGCCGFYFLHHREHIYRFVGRRRSSPLPSWSAEERCSDAR
jgi:hypothetical protein